MLKQRIITGLILAPIALAAVFWLPVNGFALFIALIIMGGAWEWANLAGFEGNSARIAYALSVGGLCLLIKMLAIPVGIILTLAMLWWVLAFLLVRGYPASAQRCSNRLVRLLMGVTTLVPAWTAIVMLKNNYGPLAIFMVLLMVWAADVGAYFSGKQFGKHSLAANVSPKKTIEGVIGGIGLSVLVAVTIGIVYDYSFAKGLGLMILTVLVVLVSVLGDLLESLLKRERGIKDSSNLLPGHGGILDRIDSLTAAVPVFALALLASGS